MWEDDRQDLVNLRRERDGLEGVTRTERTEDGVDQRPAVCCRRGKGQAEDGRQGAEVEGFRSVGREKDG